MTPDTTNYLILGYAVFSIVFVIYLFSLFVRSRNLKQDIELLQELDREKQED